jgi:outer membrane protein OmpA-like peptidoglycan-associated protein
MLGLAEPRQSRLHTRRRQSFGDDHAGDAIMGRDGLRRALRGLCFSLLLAPALAVSAGAQTGSAPAAPGKPAASLPRYLLYFDEFSAYLSPRSKKIIAQAAKRAKSEGATAITVQARASATGTPQTNMYLAETRSSIVADELETDGIPNAMIKQQPIGQTGSSDPSVFNRRVDIILER